MSQLDDHGRPEPPIAADETATLLGFLDYQRATLAWKCRGLDAAGLQAKVGASSMTLGGMLKHLAYVEDYWFSQRLHGNDRRPPFDTWTGTRSRSANPGKLDEVLALDLATLDRFYCGLLDVAGVSYHLQRQSQIHGSRWAPVLEADNPFAIR